MMKFGDDSLLMRKLQLWPCQGPEPNKLQPEVLVE